MKNYSDWIKKKAREYGASLVGVAELDPLKALRVDPPDLLEPFTKAVSIAVALPRMIFEQIRDRPTPMYKHIYQTANSVLDHIAFKVAADLQYEGFRSLPIPASQLLDMENWYGAISHKAVARMAGLGWQGKNLLIITPQFGSRVRLVSVLTDAPLFADGPIENRCGKCTICKDACPAGAIKGVGTPTNYKERDEALYFSRCVEKVVGGFSKIPEIGVPICGICIRVCPVGRTRKIGTNENAETISPG